MRCELSVMSMVSFRMRDSICEAWTDNVDLSSNWIRYCGDTAGSRGMPITIPERTTSVSGLVLATRVPGG